MDAHSGDSTDGLFSLAYEELRRLAASVRRSDRNASINPTALVNEAWLKLAASPPADGVSPLHFKRIAARAMRQVLVEAARRRGSHKRGDGIAAVTFDEGADYAVTRAGQLLDLDAALEALGRLDARQAAVVEARFFGGLDAAETAALLRISEATVLRDWRLAKAWLAKAIRGDR